MTVTEALQIRRAVPVFESGIGIQREDLDRLINLANLAPSSMNLQPWNFLLAMSDADKVRLQKVCFNQPKVTQASAVIVVVGNLLHHLNASEITQEAVKRGYYDEEKAAGTVEMAHGWFGANPQIQRDEIIRGCSLWSMAFMLGATENGWDTAPMGGFDPEGIAAEFNLPKHMIPVLVICIGKRSSEVVLAERNIRFDADRLVHETTW